MIKHVLINVLTVVGLLFVLPASALEPGDKVDNFRLLDHRGESHELYYYSDKKAVVLLVHGNGCRIVHHSLPRLEEIREQYADRGVTFLLINSNLQDDRDEIAAEAEEYGIDFPILIDDAQLVGESMGFTRTADVFVIDPQDGWTVKYRGPIDDRLYYERQLPEARNHYLTDALDAVLAGEAVKESHVDGPGCLINFPARRNRDEHENISYSEEIAPLLIDNCVQCHRPDGIGPWAMSEYEQVLGFAPMIREVLRTNRMPPWHADPKYGEFSNDRSLTVAEKRKLVHWIEAGAPRGDGPDPLPKAIEKDWPDWTLGEPDVVVELPTFKIPATGLLPYQHPIVKNPLSKQTWLRAVDFRPGNREVLHHVIASYIDTSQGGRQDPFDSIFAGYIPGGGPVIYPENTGLRVDPGDLFFYEVHYTTVGRPTSDTTRMGLYFRDEPARYQHHSRVLKDTGIRIPPRTKRHTKVVRTTFERDVVIYSLLPHAHYRGRAMAFKAVYPDGEEEILLSVPRYDFNWQHIYVLKEPKRLPAGTTVVYTTTWDNSAQNRANPDPSKEVTWGFQSTDEMLFGVINYRYAEEDD